MAPYSISETPWGEVTLPPSLVTLSECTCSGTDPTLSQQLPLCLGPLVLEEAVW